MRLLKILGSALIGCAAFFTFTASAQTQNVPVSCNWVVVSSYTAPFGYVTNLDCKEQNNNKAAGKTLVSNSGTPTTCSISLSSGVLNSGSCTSPVLYRAIVTSQCQNIGKFVGGVCANGTNSSAFGTYFQQQCGAGCTPRYENLGFINGCYSGPPNGSPYLNVYCQ